MPYHLKLTRGIGCYTNPLLTNVRRRGRLLCDVGVQPGFKYQIINMIVLSFKYQIIDTAVLSSKPE